MRPKQVYLAGPYQGTAHDWTAYCDIDANINEARRWATKLALDRVYFFCPHLMSAHFEAITPGVPAEFWYGLDLSFLEDAWGLLLLPNWEKSTGAKLEREEARRLNLPIYTTDSYAGLVGDWKQYQKRCEAN